MLERSADLDLMFHALSSPARRAIVERLGSGPVSMSELAQPSGMSLSAVAQHLRLLEQCGLVVTEKRGRVRFCRLDAKALAAAAKWIFARALWEHRLDQLGDTLAARK